MPEIFEVRAATRDGHTSSFGARRTRIEAESLLAETQAKVERVGGRNDRYWIEAIDTTGLFEIPSRPTPRERFNARVERTSSEGAWTQVHVEILDQDRVVASYDRNYSMLQTFEPFRQGERHYALVSRHYTGTTILDLASGEIVAEEEPEGSGFCPVGFYVPDWWDAHDGTTLPGSMYWSADHEWPNGDFGFVWGCVWGDDSSWKVQYLDLSALHEGVFRRDERFGYVRLATNPKLAANDFIRCSSYEGQRRVEFAVEQAYDLVTGGAIDA